MLHCAASVSFDLPLAESRSVNVEGTRRMLDFARSCTRLERFSYVSTAYVAGEPGRLFREDELAVGQSFRNPYERSKFEAELAVRSEGSASRSRSCARASWWVTAPRGARRRSTCCTGR